MNEFEIYWEKFLIQNSEGKKYYDGIKFEKLVGALLSIMYGQKWKTTGKTHDGNKDFYLIKNDKLLWAECKSYKDTIALQTLAPTLVMAQVCNADEVLFFSRSEINKYAKEKIASFGYMSSKKIIFYDASMLENLIIKYNDRLPKKFQISIKGEIFEQRNLFTTSEFFFPFIASGIITEESYQDYHSVSLIHYNEPFSLMIICCNNSIEESILEISFAEDNEDKNFFEYLDNSISSDCKSIRKENLQPGESRVILICLRAVKFKASLLLPRFTVKYITPAVSNEWTSDKKTVTCKWIGKTKLLGGQYNNIINQVSDKLVTNTSFSAMLILGNSGTGKSRVIEECHCPLLKFGYRILDINVTKDTCDSDLLKELIYFIYDVPAELIMEVITSRLEDKSLKKINDEMLQITEMLNKIEEGNIPGFIETYKELLFEKMARGKNVIIIDNMQFASTSFQKLWRKYISYSINQCRENRSILITTVNLDYITEETAKTMYILKNSNIRYIIDEVLTGFKDINQGILFLRELVHICSDEYDELFTDIIKAVSLNPFNLYQMIKLMEEDEVIKQLPSRQGYIFREGATWKSTWKIPTDINDTIKRRLDFITKYIHSDTMFYIFSACYLLEPLDNYKIEMFNINFEDLDILTERQLFIRSESGYSFVHDILRRYFEQEYSNKVLCCLQNLSMENILQYDVLYKLTQICIKKDKKYIALFCKKRNLDSIPIRVRSVFLENLFNCVITQNTAFMDNIEWIRALTWICECSRNIMGSVRALEFYQRSYDSINNMYEDFSSIYCPDLRRLLHSHCDILIQMHQRKDAVDFAHKVLHSMQKIPLQNSRQSKEEYTDIVDEYYLLKAILYNRIFCAYNNAYPCENVVLIRNNAINKSRILMANIKNSKKQKMICYMNDSDEGYRYYGLFSDYDALMSIWNKCIIDIPQIAPEKTMNYYRKCVQCALIRQDENKVKEYIKKGRDYLENGLYSHEPLIFNTFFSMAEAMCCLQHNPQESYDYVEKLIQELIKMQLLLKSNKMGDIYLLQGINAFYHNDVYTTYLALKEAYFEYQQQETTNYWIKRTLIQENIKTAYSKLDIFQKDYDISFLSPECIQQLSKKTSNVYQASGIIRTKELLFNLPLVV